MDKSGPVSTTKTLTQTKEVSAESSAFKCSGKESLSNEKRLIKSTDKLQKRWTDLQ